MGEIDISQGVLYAAIEDGEYKEYKPIGEIQSIDVESPSEHLKSFGEPMSDAFMKGLRAAEKLEFSADVKIERGYGHHKKKTFKKWLMAHGYSRDDADAICWLIAQCQGEVGYDYVRTATVLTGEVPTFYISCVGIRHMIKNITINLEDVSANET